MGANSSRSQTSISSRTVGVLVTSMAAGYAERPGYSPDMTVRAALIQLDCSTTEPVADRVPRALALVERAAKDADIVILPELWHVGAFDVDAAREHAQPIDGPLVHALGALAKEHEVWLHGGSFCEVDEDGGDLVAAYRKVHLFGFDAGETVLMSGGDELVVVDTPLGPCGVATCYDLRFPELFRGLVEGGATAFLMASGWPDARIEHWDVLTRARAIENQAWVLACNEVGQQGDVRLGGHSVVVSPTGEVVARAGTGEETLVVEIDPAAALSWREEFPALADIRIG
jgi:predicted amidohydrolase